MTPVHELAPPPPTPSTAPVDRGTTAIEWAERTINPWTGCTKVSPGCAHCYIDRTPPFRMAGRRFEGGHIPLRFHLGRLDQVLRRRKPTLYFVNSLSDAFHDDVDAGIIAALFAAMAKAPQHTFQVLTKRPERMRRLLNDAAFWFLVRAAAVGQGVIRRGVPHATVETPLPNVWLGVTIENRRFVHRADLLRDTPAAVRFISAEPLLGPLVPDGPTYCTNEPPLGPVRLDGPWSSTWTDWADGYDGPGLRLVGIDWLIAGGESGPGARRIDPQWVRELRDRCSYDRVAFLFKQWGGTTPKAGGRELDGRTHDEIPTT